jgi:hypothetical protein
VEALNAQPARNNRGRSQHDPALEVHFDRLDALDASVRGAPTLEERRTLARELFPVLARVDRLMRGDARRSGEDPQLTGYRCERHGAGRSLPSHGSPALLALGHAGRLSGGVSPTMK